MNTLNYISVTEQQILIVKTCQFTTKCKGNSHVSKQLTLGCNLASFTINIHHFHRQHRCHHGEPSYLAPDFTERPEWQRISGGGGGNADDDEDEVSDGEVDHEQTGSRARSTVDGNHEHDNQVANEAGEDDQTEESRYDDGQQDRLKPVRLAVIVVIIVVIAAKLYSQSLNEQDYFISAMYKHSY